MIKKYFACLVFVIATFCFDSNLFASNTINWKEAANYYGQYKTVEGEIVLTKCTPKVCFLNFHPNWRKYLTAVIFRSD